MKKYILLCFVSFLFISASAQKKAITDTGEEVILYQDGTWKYVNGADSARAVEVNKTPFVKPSTNTFLLKSKKFNIGFWINPKKWKVQTDKNNDDAEYELHEETNDLFAMMITEKSEIPVLTLKDIAIKNARKVAPDITIQKEEFRIVNGQKVLLVQMKGTYNGVQFIYYGYYYSNKNGSVQFVTYSTNNLLIENIKDCDDLLNGFVVLQE
ncbi:hypothetical protein KACHI17_19900 [Sediminibacterium sp. KACHI17]|uniref:DUF3157 family protein n=1 Tax=Sediminibacterium sp. KACHI17 TaxID=1751071 RepID=A0AAT9GKV7_9BACT